MLKKILDNLLFEKDIIEQLIEIDNDKMNKRINFEDYYNAIKIYSDNYYNNLELKEDTLFITEGEPLITIKLLNQLQDVDVKCVIFINQGYIAMNKWLMNQFYTVTKNSNVEIDYSINYNKYIDKNYKVFPIGEDGLINRVIADFYNN